MKTQKKLDRNTKLNNLGVKVNNLVADAEKFAINAGVSVESLRARRFETELDELFKNQENLNAELLAPRNGQLSLQVTTKRVTFAEDVPNPSLDQRPVLRTYVAEKQERERSLSPDFPSTTQRCTVRTNELVNRRRSPSPSFTPGYSNSQTKDTTDYNHILILVTFLIAIFLLINTVENNPTAPKLNP